MLCGAATRPRHLYWALFPEGPRCQKCIADERVAVAGVSSAPDSTGKLACSPKLSKRKIAGRTRVFRHGLHLVPNHDPVKAGQIFSDIDAGKSGRRKNRPDLDSLLAANLDNHLAVGL